jgi:hypothetical protein
MEAYPYVLSKPQLSRKRSTHTILTRQCTGEEVIVILSDILRQYSMLEINIATIFLVMQVHISTPINIVTILFKRVFSDNIINIL